MIQSCSTRHKYCRRLPWPGMLLLVTGLLSADVRAAGGGADENYSDANIEVSLVSETEAIEPGKPFQLAVRLAPEPGWHTYWRNPGDTGLPTRIDWILPRGGQAGPLQWPAPERIDYQGLINYGYHGETLLLTTITPPDDLRAGDSYPVRARVDWLICKEVCIPGSGTVATTLPVTAGPASPGEWAQRFADTRARLPQTLKTDQARFSLDDSLVVAVPGGAGLVAAGNDMQFFPLTDGIVANAAEPRFHRRGDTLLIRAERSPDFDGSVPDRFEGLLVLRDGDQTRAWRFASRASSEPIAFPARRQSGGLLSILLLAFAGGFILNLMPCVFPVLSIKILSLIKSGGHEPRQRKLHGLAYTGGILASILVFAAVLLAVRAAGEAAGWGFQLQSPWFVAVLIYILFLMGLSLSGFADIGASLSRAGNLFHERRGLTGSFLNGTLATVVATPCTVPFMATAVGFAMTQSSPVALLVFGVLGLGLASPFLLLAFLPFLAERLPKPGPWMETLKQLLAFPLYFTVVWLLWVLGRQTDSGVAALVMAGMVLLGLALWLWRRAGFSRRPALPRAFALFALLTAVALLPGLATPVRVSERAPAAAAEYEYPAVAYSETRLRAALANHRPVFVNINADWCITCKVNERLALDDESVRRAFRDRNVLYMTGDWTNGDETLSRVLASFGRSGVPLYLLYLPGKPEPKVLPQLLTPSTVIGALEG